MTKLMSKREMALFRIAIHYCNEYHKFNPNVGPIPLIEDIADRIAKQTGFEWDEDDVAECCEQIIGS